MSEPFSKNIGTYNAGEYIITAALWHGLMGESYEIGIRNKNTGEFKLFQGDFNHQTVQEVANSIAHLLAIPGECYTPEWCMEHFK
jgi:hypothetical protein